MTTTTAVAGLSEQKRTYLRVLAILHYVHGGLIALIALAMVALFGFGLLGSRGELGIGEGCMVWAMVTFALLVVVAYAGMNVLAGRWLDQRRNWVGVIVISAINALNVPLGTLLGVFTIVVLVGEDVRSAFEGQPTAAVTPPAPTV